VTDVALISLQLALVALAGDHLDQAAEQPLVEAPARRRSATQAQDLFPAAGPSPCPCSSATTGKREVRELLVEACFAHAPRFLADAYAATVEP
jgi:hypothetical protein